MSKKILNDLELAAGARIRGLPAPVNDDEPARKGDLASAGGGASISLTYTGKFRTGLALQLVSGTAAILPTVAGGGSMKFSPPTGAHIVQFVYSEGSATTGDRLTSLTFDDLVDVATTFNPSAMAAQESLALPVYPELTDEQAAYVVRSIRDFVALQGK